MSNEAQTWVIQCSGHKGGPLLLLYMIANHAHPDGTHATASEKTLARETRMSERQVRRIIAEKLLPSGELERVLDVGPYGVTGYQLPLVQPWLDQQDKMSGRKRQQDKMSARSNKADILSGSGEETRDSTGHFVTSTGHSEKPLPDISTNLPDISCDEEEAISPVPTAQTDDSGDAQPINPELIQPKNPEGGITPARVRDTPPVPIDRGTRIPDPFVVTAAMLAWCDTEGVPRDFAKARTAGFVEFWASLPGDKGIRTNWPGLWRKWVRDDWEKRQASGRRRA